MIQKRSRGCAACGVRKYHGCSRTTLFVCGQRVCRCGECVATHVCRGNFHSTYASSGAYDAVAEVLFGEENAAGYYLEFDDERSGGFAPLAKVSGNKKIVLGLVTTKSSVLESKKAIIERIHEAEKYVPLDRLYLSPQCGFASCEIGNKLTEEQQWAKLKLVKEIAEEVWERKGKSSLLV